MDRATELLVEFHGMKPLAEYAVSLEMVLATSYEQKTQRISELEKQIVQQMHHAKTIDRTIELEKQVKTLTSEALQREQDFLLQLMAIKKTFTANRY
jgi:hypothetical protein